MESLFEASTVLTTEDLYEYGLIAKRNKRNIIMFIFGLVSFFILLPLAVYSLSIAYSFMIMFVGILLNFYFLFYEERIVRHLFNPKNYRVLEQKNYFEFYDDYFRIHNENVDEKLKYCCIKKIVISQKRVFIFKNGMSVSVIPKEALTKGIPEQFQDFLVSKTHLYPVVLKHKHKIAIFLKCMILLLMVVLSLLFSEVVCDSIRSKPETFSAYGYSIELNGYFNEYVDHEYYISANAPYKAFSMYGVDAETYIIEDEKVTPSAGQFASDLGAEYKDITNLSSVKYIGENAYITYNYKVDGKNYFYMDVVTLADGYYWVSEFRCDYINQNRYIEQFINWAQTIKVEDY